MDNMQVSKTGKLESEKNPGELSRECQSIVLHTGSGIR